MNRSLLVPIGICLLLGFGLTVFIGCQQSSLTEAPVVSQSQAQFDPLDFEAAVALLREAEDARHQQYRIVVKPDFEAFSEAHILASFAHGETVTGRYYAVIPFGISSGLSLGKAVKQCVANLGDPSNMEYYASCVSECKEVLWVYTDEHQGIHVVTCET